MAKFNTNQCLRDLKGNPMKGRDDEIITVGSAAVEALLGAGKDLTPEQKLQRYALATKINAAAPKDENKVGDPKTVTEISLTAKEIVLIDEACGLGWQPWMYGQLHEIINA
jgi:hypothetical protein